MRADVKSTGNRGPDGAPGTAEAGPAGPLRSEFAHGKVTGGFSHPTRPGVVAASAPGALGAPKGSIVSKRLFVGNLSFSTTEDDLQQAFAPYGSTNASIPVNETGRSKGFGFVDVADDQLQAAIDAMNGTSLGGRSINVNEARPREDRGGGGGRSGYGGGGYGGGGYGGGRDRGDRGGGGDRW
jgi:RNA recognition motif-containing protein